MIGQLQAPVTLLPWKELPVIIDKYVEWDSQQVRVFWGIQENVLLLPGMELRPLGRPVRSLVTILSELPCLLKSYLAVNIQI